MITIGKRYSVPNNDGVGSEVYDVLVTGFLPAGTKVYDHPGAEPRVLNERVTVRLDMPHDTRLHGWTAECDREWFEANAKSL